jgi:hypothetical protein
VVVCVLLKEKHPGSHLEAWLPPAGQLRSCWICASRTSYSECFCAGEAGGHERTAARPVAVPPPRSRDGQRPLTGECLGLMRPPQGGGGRGRRMALPSRSSWRCGKGAAPLRSRMSTRR